MIEKCVCVRVFVYKARLRLNPKKEEIKYPTSLHQYAPVEGEMFNANSKRLGGNLLTLGWSRDTWLGVRQIARQP